MKNILMLILLLVFTSSCVSRRETITTINPDLKYHIKDPASVTVGTGRIWILFIPFGGGPRTYTARKEKAIHGFLKQNEADAIAHGTIVDRKVVIPLILITFSSRWAILTGKPAVIDQGGQPSQ
jgi:hypothetical protein